MPREVAAPPASSVKAGLKTEMFSERKLSPTELPSAIVHKKSTGLEPNNRENIETKPVTPSQIQIRPITANWQMNWSVRDEKPPIENKTSPKKSQKESIDMKQSNKEDRSISPKLRGIHAKPPIHHLHERNEEEHQRRNSIRGNEDPKQIRKESIEVKQSSKEDRSISPKRSGTNSKPPTYHLQERNEEDNQRRNSREEPKQIRRKEDRATSPIRPATHAKRSEHEEKTQQNIPKEQEKQRTSPKQKESIELKQSNKEDRSVSPKRPVAQERRNSIKMGEKSTGEEPKTQAHRTIRRENSEARKIHERSSSGTRPATKGQKHEEKPRNKETRPKPKEYPESEDDEPRKGPLQYGTISNNQAKNLEKLYQDHDRFPAGKVVRKFANSYHLTIIDVEIWLETRRELTYRRFVKQGLEMDPSVIKFYSEAMKMAEGIRLEQPSIRSRSFFSLEGVSEIEAKKDKEEQSQPCLILSTNKMFVSKDKKEKCQIVIKNGGQTNIVYQLSMMNSENYTMSPLCAILHADEELTLNITRKAGPIQPEEFFRIEYGRNPDGLIDAREAANRAEMSACEIVQVVAIDEGEMKIMR